MKFKKRLDKIEYEIYEVLEYTKYPRDKNGDILTGLIV